MGGMSLFDDHPRARWIAPVAALAVVGGASFVASRTASADPSLPERSAAQLLVDVQQASVKSLSGTVVQTSNLGLPEIPGGAGPDGGASSSLSSLVSGTHTWRVWYAGPTQSRLALVGSMGESDIIRNGKDVWVWSSRDKTAMHHVLTADQAGKPGHDSSKAPTPSDLPKTPEEAAQRALAAIDPTTSVTTSGSAVVAGRQAYELLLKPKDSGSLVSQVRIAVDAERHLPLRVQVYSVKTPNPAFEVGFTSIDFAKPAARQFAFNPPPGTKVTETKDHARPDSPDQTTPGAKDLARPTVVGSGWGSVLVATLPAGATGNGSSGNSGDSAKGLEQLQGVLSALPRTSGPWGSGRVLQGTLFSAVVTDDGRVAVGAVTPERLYAALAAK